MSSELDRFRQEWQREVNERHSSGRNRDQRPNNGRTNDPKRASAEALPRETIVEPEVNTIHSDEFFRAQRPIENVVNNSKLSQTDLKAIDLFEMAVDMEHSGQMSDAVKYYRLAFKSNEKVDKLYREKYYSKQTNKSNRSHLPSQSQTQSSRTVQPKKMVDDESLLVMSDKLKKMSLSKEEIEEETAVKNSESKLLQMPNEVIALILEKLALQDLGSFTMATYTCRKLAVVGYTNVRMWRKLCTKAFDKQHYDAEVDLEEYVSGFSSWRAMFKQRPRIEFNGVYISTCNYLRPGLAQTWNNPLHMVTYYRYLRFFEDGTCMNLLTTAAPADIVPVFKRDVVGDKEDEESVAVYKKDDGTVLTRPAGIMQGTWKIMNKEGRLLIESEGSVDRYIFFMEFDIKSSGKHKHNKLKWRNFWSVNKITQDEAEFSLKNDKAYYFVKSRF